MTRFVCRKCNYRFESKSKPSDKRCPYCESKEIIEEPSIDELINEAWCKNGWKKRKCYSKFYSGD